MKKILYFVQRLKKQWVIKYEEDFILCSKIEETMGLIPKLKNHSIKNASDFIKNNASSKIYSLNVKNKLQTL